MDLTGIQLTRVNLTNTNFTNTNLTNAKIEQTNISGAKFLASILTGLRTNVITGTPQNLPAKWVMVNAYTSHFNTWGGNLVGPGANLQNAKLNYVNLPAIDLTGANLTNTTLVEANLTGATLIGANGTLISGTPVALPYGWNIINGTLTQT